MRQVYALSPEQIRVREILNKNFLEIEIWAISNADPNRNESCFTVESQKKALPRFTNKPILGFFNRSQDFEEHNAKVSYDSELDRDYWDTINGEQILGFIRESDKREIIEKDGLSWMYCTAMICTQYNYKQVKRLLKDKRKKVSVEVEVFESEIKNGIEYIYDFDLLGITILGSKGGIPVKEGIEGAHLSVLDLMDTHTYQSQKQALVFAYNSLNGQEVSTLAEEKKGTEGALKVNKSKEAMSDTEWGEVDKTELRNRVVAASNFKSIAGDVFLDLREGWEEGETSKLKYPVMQLKDGNELVYNRGGLASAKGYAEKNHEEEVLKKLHKIYKDLDLDEGSEKYDCEQFCDLYDDEPDDVDDPDEDECNCPDTNIKTEGEHSMEEDENNVATQCDFQAQCDELRMKCEEYEAKCAEYEARCTEYESKIQAMECDMEKYADYEDTKKALEAANTELEAMRNVQKEKDKEEQLAYVGILSKKMGLSEDEVKGVTEKCNAYQFASHEEIEKEIGYLCLQKTLMSQNETSKRFASGIIETVIPQVENGKPFTRKADVRDRLKNNLK